MNSRVTWPERYPRLGWNITYTPLGAVASGEKVLLDDTNESLRLNRLRSHCMIATTPSTTQPNEDSLFLAAILLKILQRGSLARLPQALERALGPNFTPLQISGDAHREISTSLPLMQRPIELDPTFDLHPDLEEPFWDEVNRDNPENARWLTPQASLEALATLDVNQTGWVDFLYYSPFSSKTVSVIELDGSQHDQQGVRDKQREEQVLKKSGIATKRAREGFSGLTKEMTGLPAIEGRSNRNYDVAADESMFLPSGLIRFASAIALMLANGDIQPTAILEIQLKTDQRKLLSSGKFIFEFIHSIERLWNLTSLPREIRINGLTVFTSSKFHNVPLDLPVQEITIQIFQHIPPHQALGSPSSPTCIIRGAFLPVELKFLPPLNPRARFLNIRSENTELILRDLLVDIFGHEDFRPNQLEAIKAGLAGQDSIVLLPTGSGKSVIYQMVGLLQPGITLVVDPITSLIDDQVRSLNQIGIERTFGLHSSLGASTADLEELQMSIAQGQAMFVLIAPERLQTKRFRETLAALAINTYINSAVLDEAHCISEWGHDFRTAYLNVARNLRDLCRHDEFTPTIIALTGTASPAVLRDIKRELQSETTTLKEIRPQSHDRPNLHYLVQVAQAGTEYQVLNEVISKTLPELIGQDADQFFIPRGAKTNSGIIFTTNMDGRFKKGDKVVTQISQLVHRMSLKSGEAKDDLVERYSTKKPKWMSTGNWDQVKRENARRFIENEISILVATKSFGMGIDKPNIRWTVHFGYPSSLEAFAQESGRSGRDDENSYCILIATPAEAEDVKRILDLTLETETRRRGYSSSSLENTDLAIHMHFHTSSFKGSISALAHCEAVLSSLDKDNKRPRIVPNLQDFANSQVEVSHQVLRKIKKETDNPWQHIPLKDWGADQDSRQLTESAIYRLCAIGVIDDYLVDYNSQTFILKFGQCTNISIDDALLRSIKRIAPGKTSNIQNKIGSAPNDFRLRVRHHLKIYIETLYDTIEPARIRALTEMQQLASSGLSGTQVKDRLNAYLSNGPLATAIEEIADAQYLDVSEFTSLLDTVGTEDSNIWIGVSARQLESYPDNPILLSARVVGEGWRETPDSGIIESALNSAFSVLDQYQIDTDQAEMLLTWLTNKFDEQPLHSLGPKYDALVTAWVSNNLPEAPLVAWESDVLEKALANPAWLKQLTKVRQRRMNRTTTQLNKEIERLMS